MKPNIFGVLSSILCGSKICAYDALTFPVITLVSFLIVLSCLYTVLFNFYSLSKSSSADCFIAGRLSDSVASVNLPCGFSIKPSAILENAFCRLIFLNS